MMETTSLLWHDYETWGTNPRADFPSQFAAIRTDLDLNIIEEPVVLYASPPSDRLPQPMACLVTGQTPQKILAQNPLSPLEFIRQINAMMSQPNTCTVGYNNLRFDDEVTRFALYRNLMDPYAREWQNGCSRWDIIDMLRLTRSLRPQGIEWPVNDEGRPSMRLEDLTRANAIDHGQAHDALADVYATIEMAKRVKTCQPKLYDYVFTHRNKKEVASLLNLTDPQMVLHVSGMYPTDKGNLAVVLPIAQDPNNQNAIAVYDLRVDPAILQQDPETLHRLLFSKQSELAENETRLPIKTIHINKCPVVAPLNTLNKEAQTTFAIDLQQCAAHAETLNAMPALAHTIQQVLTMTQFEKSSDPDAALYDGFISNQDRNTCNALLSTPPDALKLEQFQFRDARLGELALRFKARNYPHLLSDTEQQHWQAHCQAQVHDSGALKAFQQEIAHLLQDPERSKQDQEILKELAQWPAHL